MAKPNPAPWGHQLSRAERVEGGKRSGETRRRKARETGLEPIPAFKHGLHSRFVKEARRRLAAVVRQKGVSPPEVELKALERDLAMIRVLMAPFVAKLSKRSVKWQTTTPEGCETRRAFMAYAELVLKTSAVLTTTRERSPPMVPSAEQPLTMDAIWKEIGPDHQLRQVPAEAKVLD